MTTQDIQTSELPSSQAAPQLKGARALVTGGSRGIGEAVARRLAGAGAEVAITYASSRDKAQAVAEDLRQDGSQRSLALQADANDPHIVAEAVEKAAQELGGLDLLINNAAIFEMAPLAELTLEDFDRTLNINVRSVFTATKAAAEKMGQGGRIITIGSVNSDWIPFPGLSAYSMSKAAVAALTKAWARDLGERGITVNAIQPGPVDTDMNPAEGDFADTLRGFTALGRYGQSEEIADAVAFLASPQAAYITGAILDVDGGIRI